MFEVGNKVQLRKRVKRFTYGQGDVSYEEIGVVVKTHWYGDCKELIIDFPTCPSWRGVESEVKKARNTTNYMANITHTEMPGCCTAMVLSSFGNSKYGYGGSYRFSKRSIRKALQYAKETFNGLGCLVATTTSEQTKVAEVLEEFGFYKTKPMKKLNHDDVNLTLWHYPILGYATETEEVKG